MALLTAVWLLPVFPFAARISSDDNTIITIQSRSPIAVVFSACESRVAEGSERSGSRIIAVGSRADATRIGRDFGPDVSEFVALAKRLPVPGEAHPRGAGASRTQLAAFARAGEAFVAGAYVLPSSQAALPRVVNVSTELTPGAALWSNPKLRVIPMTWAGRSETTGASMLAVTLRRNAVRGA